jgi:hypothetical protein
LSHNHSQQLRQFIRQWHPSVTLQTLQEEVNALEEVHECIMARRNISYSLRMDVMRNRDKRAEGKAYSEKNTDPGKDCFGR